MRRTVSSWGQLWQRLWRPLQKGRRNRKGRRAAAQQLEPREMLTASIAVFDGGTQIYNASSDSFGSVSVGTSASHTITLANSGDETLDVSSVSATTGFNVQGSFPQEIAPGNSATFTLSLDTSSPATYYSQLDIASNDPSNADFSVSLDGTVTGIPSLNLYDGSTQLANADHDSFGSVAVGGTASKSFDIVNHGTGTLNVGSLTLPNGFYTDSMFPLSVGAGQSATFDVSLYTWGAGVPARCQSRRHCEPRPLARHAACGQWEHADQQHRRWRQRDVRGAARCPAGWPTIPWPGSRPTARRPWRTPSPSRATGTRWPATSRHKM